MRATDFETRPALAYGLALTAWGVAFGLRLVLNPWFPPGFPYLTFFPAVVIVAYYAGLWPATLTAVLSGLTAWWFWIGKPGFDWGLATAVALVFFIFVVAVDIFFIHGMRAATRKLKAEVERSTALAHSRDLLLREVQHRVSNNIQVVSALLSLEAGASTDPKVRRVLNEAAGRTGVIAKVQRGLLDAHGRATSFHDFAQPLAQDALTAAGRTDVEVTVVPTGVSLSAEEATPVMLTMLECVNNALEHGLPDRAGRIQVRLEEEDGQRRLEVRDDGQGLAETFDPARPASLGLQILKGLATQLGGRFDIAAAQPGVRCRLIYPAP
ncbi:sensor histidine kinase [Brevundimonas sp. SORGH_AS_0993]|uniref:sensor histidine kinase n=1 Tax=Brevundimonas sp. SORGH_AS_0993 TaxID=3041794 RepID=UPI0027D8AC5A|nr:histidine kinase dimerization/phosphoacceptor domain -containing protein [Brevundimonas sp. SORGH_AS_0993]